MIDGLTGLDETILIADQGAVTVARVFFSELIALYCEPKSINSNRFAQIESALFEELCLAFGVDHTNKPLNRPKVNNKFKRFFCTLVIMLRRVLLVRPYDLKFFCKLW